MEVKGCKQEHRGSEEGRGGGSIGGESKKQTQVVVGWEEEVWKGSVGA